MHGRWSNQPKTVQERWWVILSQADVAIDQYAIAEGHVGQGLELLSVADCE